MSPIDLDRLAQLVKTTRGTGYGPIELPISTVAALIRAVKAAQVIAGFGWDSPYQPERNEALIALDEALAPFRDAGGQGAA